MKIKQYSKGQHSYTKWGKTKKIEQKHKKPLIEYSDSVQEFYSNLVVIEVKEKGFTLSFYKRFFPSNKKNIQKKVFLHYKTLKNFKNDLEQALKKESDNVE